MDLAKNVELTVTIKLIMSKIAKENIFYKRTLPHIHPRDGIFFITFRLANSLPTNVLIKLKEERADEIKLLEKKFPSLFHSYKSDQSRRTCCRRKWNQHSFVFSN